MSHLLAGDSVDLPQQLLGLLLVKRVEGGSCQGGSQCLVLLNLLGRLTSEDLVRIRGGGIGGAPSRVETPCVGREGHSSRRGALESPPGVRLQASRAMRQKLTLLLREEEVWVNTAEDPAALVLQPFV